MEFSDNLPIYRQIVDYCHDRIASGAWAPESRVPSTKDMAVELSVNNRTVLKAYDDLSDEGIIYQRRGLGYFVAPSAPQLILELRRRDFFERVLPDVARRMRSLGLTPQDVLPILEKS